MVVEKKILAEQLEGAGAALEAGDFASAMQAYQQILAEHPSQPDALHRLGVLYSQMGLPEKAKPLLIEARIRLLALECAQGKGHSPLYPLFTGNLGRCYQMLGEISTGAALLREAVNYGAPEPMREWLREAATQAASEVELDQAWNKHLIVECGHMLERGLAQAALQTLQELSFNFPQDLDAQHYLGVALHLLGRSLEAKPLLERVLAAAPERRDFRVNYANVLRSIGSVDEAISQYQKLLADNPKDADALNNLGNVYLTQNRLQEAIQCYQNAIANDPNMYQAYLNLGAIELKRKNWRGAAPHYEAALKLRPNEAGALSNLSVIQRETGNIETAIAIGEKAVAIDSTRADIWTNLGNHYRFAGDLERSEAAYSKALELAPNDPDALNNWGNHLSIINRLGEARSFLERVLIAKGGNVSAALNNLGGILLRQGEVEIARSHFLRAFEADPDNSSAITNYLLAGNYIDTVSGLQRRKETEHWCQQLYVRIQPHPRTKLHIRSGCKIKIGFVSGDFAWHSVAQFLAPLIHHLDRREFEVYCYANNFKEDEWTDRFRSTTDHWRSIANTPDEVVVDLIRKDSIDVLIDVSGHTAGNRLGVFAHAPAPVQASWLGYVATTGLHTMNYRIVDWNTDPVTTPPEWNTESLIRLPRILQCYRALDHVPDPVHPDPSQPLTFGCFNNFAKVTPDVLACWGRILAADRNFMLYLKAAGLDDEPLQVQTVTRLCDAGAHGSQIRFAGKMGHTKHYAEFSKIHIALDPFPFNGATTTFETLYMGVPVVALKGASTIGRMSCSVLRNLGLQDWVANTVDEYIELAVRKARATMELQELRSKLRTRMLASPCMDEKGFARDFESAIWTMLDQTLRKNAQESQ